MGSRGPIPKLAGQRRRRNKPTTSTTTATGSSDVQVPDPDPEWHPVAARWFTALAESAQADLYEPSDWATAYLVAEAMSRELKPQCIGATKEGVPIMHELPPKGASLSGWLKAFTALMATEGDRRRAHLELKRLPAHDTDSDSEVAWLEDARNRLTHPTNNGA